MMGPEPQRRQCQDVLSRQMAPAPQQVMQYVAPPMPEPVSFARDERQEDQIDIQSARSSFDYSINEPLIQDEEEIASDRQRSASFV